MTSPARIRPSLRRAAFMAALGALMVPATAGASVDAHASAKKKKTKLPVVTRVTPMHVEIGQKLEIRGHYFRRGRNRNTVVFKRSGGKAVFVKADVGTTKLLRLTVPATLQRELVTAGTTQLPTRFRVRVLAKRFGKRFTKASRSPIVSLTTPPKPPGYVESTPDGDCDGDGVKNRSDNDDDNDGLTDSVEQSLNLNPCKGDTDGDGVEDRFEFDCNHDGVLNRDQSDDDGDLLPDDLEATIHTDPCNMDTDGDGIEDGYEYRSAIDLNNDQYQDPNESMPYPGKRPYPNPLDGTDANTDHDGDSLTLGEEQSLWKFTYSQPGKSRSLGSLYYSDGLKYSIYRLGEGDRHEPALASSGYDKQIDFQNWLNVSHYSTVYLPNEPSANKRFSILDVNHDRSVSDTPESGYDHSERFYLDTNANGWLSDDERDEDADGLSNFDETHGRMVPGYWGGVYSRETAFHIAYAGTNAADPDSDGDGVRDGADDQDHDDIPNIMEISRRSATGRPLDASDLDESLGNPSPAFGRVNPFNPCLPDTGSRTCPTYIPVGGGAWAPFDDNDPDYLVLQ